MSTMDGTDTRPVGPLTPDHAHLILDALDRLRADVQAGYQPWTEYGPPREIDPLSTEARWRALLDAADYVMAWIAGTAGEGESGLVSPRSWRSL
jgi:hypothetical protein